MARRLSYDEHRRWLDLSRSLLPQAYPAQGSGRTSVGSSRARNLRARSLEREKAEKDAVREMTAGVGRPGRFSGLAAQLSRSTGAAGAPGDFARNETSMTPREQARFDRDQARAWRDREMAENRRRGIPSLLSMETAARARRVRVDDPNLVLAARRGRQVRWFQDEGARRRESLLGMMRQYGLAGDAARKVKFTDANGVPQERTYKDFYDRLSSFHESTRGQGGKRTQAERDFIKNALLPAIREHAGAAMNEYTGSLANRPARIYKGPMTRAGQIALLEQEKTGVSWTRGLQNVPYGGVKQRGFMDDVQDSAGYIAASAAAASGQRGGTGYSRRSSGTAGQLRYSGTVKQNGAGGLTGSERMSAVSSGGGYGGDFVQMGGGPASVASKAYAGILREGYLNNPGGRYLGNDSAGAPMFEKSTRGGFVQTSKEEKDWRYRQSQIDKARTKLYNDWVVQGGGGEYRRMRQQQRFDSWLADRDTALMKRVQDTISAYDRLAREVGEPVYTFSAPGSAGVRAPMNPQVAENAEAQRYRGQAPEPTVEEDETHDPNWTPA